VGPVNGIINVFDQEGNFIRRFASNGPLNAPWGVVQASANFGRFSNDILIGNFGDGTISAFDHRKFSRSAPGRIGQNNQQPRTLGSVFRSDGVGNPNTLYFTAGSSGEDHGPVRRNFSSELSPSRKRMSAPAPSFQFALETIGDKVKAPE